jgi:hypothetical protein
LRTLSLLAGVVAVVAFGALYMSGGDGAATPEPIASVATTKPTAPSTSANEPGEAPAPSPAQMDVVATLLGDARRLATEGKVDQAKAEVDKAAKIIPGSSDIAQARVDIAQMSAPQYRLAQQLSRARLAIAQGDRLEAEAALAAATAIEPTAPQIAELRQELQRTEQKEAERNRRIADLLAEMRQAIARHDLVAADRALNEAERLDIRDPAIDPARVELAHAQQDAARSR